ncbi:hypothetical protein GOARA_043_00690 [Gordonia araii NBRC 100433]|uniref:Mycothiol-dependent maleylpyruvate isomerase metal-binding domain-containing protein n=1 Tax=Gordonia araii NBRC 100433 TaxID=1073574 RepID=G7H133_9ACTN|nr:TIGR03086 family metal-binding protein [Gordonia araii]NNG96720.1 TIGR03086 family protein [Gordonia araii NBRC 100433]GAB09594.1 hypothetical protein GOARA_043_00690 [Gordonia araii NBRC 100433]
MTPTDDLRNALGALSEVVGRIRGNGWTMDTPCESWSVADVLAHVVVVTRKFTAFAAGHTDSPRARPLKYLDADLPGLLEHAALDSARAWKDCDLARICHLPFGTFTAGEAATINSMDVLVHTWDIAIATGIPYAMPPQLLAPAVEMARRLATAEAVAAKQFGPPVLVEDDGPSEAMLLGLTGRDPRR